MASARDCTLGNHELSEYARTWQPSAAVPILAIGRQAATRWLREQGFRIVAADPAGSRSYRDVDYRGPVAIVV